MDFGPHAFTARQLQYVVAVAEERNFGAAAQRCLVSQPSLSAQVAELESALGVRLFERDRRGVLLTPAGKVLVAHSRQALLAFENLRDAARQLVDPLKGRLRLGVIPTLAPYALPYLDAALREAFPDLALVWREEKTESLSAALATGDVDAALVALEAELGDVEHEILAEDRFVLAAPVGHRLGRSSRPVGVGELKGEGVLLLEDGHCFRNQALELCAAAGTRELGFRATSLATLAQMVAGGAGITLFPRLAAVVEGRNEKLVIRELKPPRPKRTIALIWRRGSALADSLRAVARVARKAIPRS
jgi:LysR family hydrogen peroxide-inducible transcriptional activator